MKRRIPSFGAGLIVGVLALGLATTVWAAFGSVSYSAVDIQFWRGNESQTIASGDTYTGENGVQVPASITYIDENNGGTTFISLRKVAELLDAPIHWDGESETIYFGTSPIDGDVITETGTDTVTVQPLPTAPVLDVKAGPFTEVAPLGAEKGIETPLLQEASFSSRTGFINQRYEIFEPYGRYVEITVTNHGDPVEMRVCRPYYTASDLSSDAFTTVRIESGQSLTRAFLMDEGTAFPENYLRLDVDNVTHGPDAPAVDITVSVSQFQV